MKIEKLTENKIRIIVNSSDLEEDIGDTNTLMKKMLEKKNFFADILEQAKKQVGFNADGCKLLIESFSSLDDFLIFTVTKVSQNNLSDTFKTTPAHTFARRLVVKRKPLVLSKKQSIYKFSDFDCFCDFCKYINCQHDLDMKKFSKDISLYLFNDTYYLVLKNVNVAYKYTPTFYSIIAEFLEPVHFSSGFESKLLEYGKLIMKKNAIGMGIKYFA